MNQPKRSLPLPQFMLVFSRNIFIVCFILRLIEWTNVLMVLIKNICDAELVFNEDVIWHGNLSLSIEVLYPKQLILVGYT